MPKKAPANVTPIKRPTKKVPPTNNTSTPSKPEPTTTSRATRVQKETRKRNPPKPRDTESDHSTNHLPNQEQPPITDTTPSLSEVSGITNPVPRTGPYIGTEQNSYLISNGANTYLMLLQLSRLRQ